ncbi:RNA polymerase-associated protein rtf1 [Tieghemiomyces parasiticus]|uniref:RNA polymerase-associated protein rtf1 n=1 Tax=Tieghemiomyces parasiticus TaxID=78921 RepID=A0A9W7ZUM7_9FUNG|nr:RNA polymerase-associated protein rtf1 [Tieghemiomyces parasiticus]
MSDDLSDEILALYDGDSAELQASRHQHRNVAMTDSELDLSDDDAPLPSHRRTGAAHDDHMDVDNADDVDGFGPDLMGDEADRRRLMAMPEIEREHILSERAERRQKLQERAEVRRKLRESQHHHRPGADDDEDEEDGGRARRSGRSAALTSRGLEKSRGLSELKRRREEHGHRRRRAASPTYSDQSSDGYGARTDRTRRRGSYSDSYDSSDGSERESRSRTRRHREDIAGVDAEAIPATLEELNSILLTRRRLERWVHSPFFDTTVVGCVVRLGLGQDKDRRPVYRACEVTAVGTVDRPYQIETAFTDKRLILQHGDSVRAFPMSNISNAPLTPQEYERLVSTLRTQDRPPITADQVARKRQDLDAAERYVLTDQEVQSMIQLRQRLSGAPTNLVARKESLTRQREEAEQNERWDDVRQLDEDITKLGTAITRASYTNENLTRLAEVNQRNRRLNQEEGRRAEERRKGDGTTTGGSGATDPAKLRSLLATEPTHPALNADDVAAILTNLDGLTSLNNAKTMKVQADQIRQAVESVSEEALRVGQATPLTAYDKLWANIDIDMGINLPDLYTV